MDKKNNSRDNDIEEKQDDGKFWSIGRDIKEHKVEQELKKEDGLTWEQDRITYLDRWIYIPNNRKIKEQIL